MLKHIEATFKYLKHFHSNRWTETFLSNVSMYHLQTTLSLDIFLGPKCALKERCLQRQSWKCYRFGKKKCSSRCCLEHTFLEGRRPVSIAHRSGSAPKIAPCPSQVFNTYLLNIWTERLTDQYSMISLWQKKQNKINPINVRGKKCSIILYSSVCHKSRGAFSIEKNMAQAYS